MLENYTNYKEEELRECVQEMNRVLGLAYESVIKNDYQGSPFLASISS